MWSNQCESSPALSVTPPHPRNLLLQSLPRQQLERLSPCLQRVPLVPKRFLQHAGLPIEHIYFVEEGLVSVLAKTDERDAVEVWLIGREGAIGSAAILGAKASALSHFVQIGGSALRIAIEDLDRAMAESPQLRGVLHNYLHTALMQSSQSAACNLRHLFLQRLARWLLTAQDRSGLDQLPITQERVARSLGVHRPTVSGAFKLLERHGIVTERGLVRILDRASLERVACRCYRNTRPTQEGRERSKTRRNLLIALSGLGALFEIELLAS
jgi:CRP-like cAMP-binding protein